MAKKSRGVGKAAAEPAAPGTGPGSGTGSAGAVAKKKAARPATKAGKPAGRGAAAADSRPVPVHVISHTHWDRAWYLPFSAFRLRLVEVMDDLIDTLKSDRSYKFFHLDGQIIPLLDYLEVRPGRRADLQALIDSGRLVIGPHYILPDEFLVSGESLIRNLLLGVRETSAFGAPARIGYMPDSFGHVSQVPQLLRGFGIDNFIFTRGLTESAYECGTEFLWRAPDGQSEVLAINQHFGYGGQHALGHRYGDLLFQPYEERRARLEAEKIVEALLTRSPSRVLLFCNGMDHQPVQRSLAEAIRDANRRGAGRYELRHSTYAAYLADVRRAGVALKTYTGALRGALRHPNLPGVYSARLYLKKENAACQVLLERHLEPVATVAALEGYAYPADSIRKTWKTLLENHPHDDICGCSVDAVHRENLTRYAQVEQAGEWLLSRALDHLLFQADLPGSSAGTPLLVFNTLAFPRAASVRAVVDIPAADVAAPYGLALTSSDGAPIPAAFAPLDEPYQEEWAWGEERRRRVRVEFVVPELPAGGYEVFFIKRAGATAPSEVATTGPALPVGSLHLLENRALRVEALDDGMLIIRDRATNKVIARTNFFEDLGDRGDEYDFDPVPGELRGLVQGRGVAWAITQRTPGRIVARLERILLVPERLQPGRAARSLTYVEIPMRTDITLYTASPRVDVRLTFVNRAQDHRLRVGVEVPGVTPSVAVESKFDVARHPVGVPAIRPGASSLHAQVPVGTGPQNDYVLIQTPDSSVAVVNQGLPEFETEERGGATRYWLTILRAVGYLSRGDLANRPGHAGPGIATPEAQCPGEQQAEFSLYFPGVGTGTVPVAAAALDILTPPLTASFQHQHRFARGTHKLPLRHSFYAVEPSSVAVSAVKWAEAGGAAVVRLWNPTDEPTTATVTFDRPLKSAKLLRLDETPLAPLAIRDPESRRVRVEVQPRQIVTLAVTPRILPKTPFRPNA